MKNLLSRKTRSSSAHFSGYCAFSDIIYPIVMQKSGIFKNEKYSIDFETAISQTRNVWSFQKDFLKWSPNVWNVLSHRFAIYFSVVFDSTFFLKPWSHLFCTDFWD